MTDKNKLDKLAVELSDLKASLQAIEIYIESLEDELEDADEFRLKEINDELANANHKEVRLSEAIEAKEEEIAEIEEA